MLAYGFDVRRTASDALVGVGLVIPNQRRIMFVSGASVDMTTDASLPTSVVDDAMAWTAAGDATLPRRPAPLSSSVVAALLPTSDAAEFVAHRFAAFPLDDRSTHADAQSKILSQLFSIRSAS